LLSSKDPAGSHHLEIFPIREFSARPALPLATIYIGHTESILLNMDSVQQLQLLGVMKESQEDFTMY
jgi:hypothetical protein